MKIDSRLIAKYAIIVALIIVAYSIDSLLISPFLPIRIAVTTLLTILTIVQLFDLKTAIFTTTTFGVLSFIYAYLFPNFVSPAFMNPLISILPRIMIGLVSFLVLNYAKKVTKNSQNTFVKKYVTSSIAAVCGVLTNTILVLSMMSVFDSEMNLIQTVIKVIIGINFPLEFATGLLVVPLLVNAVKDKIKI